MRTVDRFEGHIAAVGCALGMRIVVGMWHRSPFGPFADVMVQRHDGDRILLAPDPAVADYVRSTYLFDEVIITDVATNRDGINNCNTVRVQAGPLDLTIQCGGRTALGRALSLLPGALTVHPLWLQAVNPVASLLVPGARTAGTTGNGHTEYYGVWDFHHITSMSGTWDGVSLGGLRPVKPPVTFSFSSTPATPAIASVVTTIKRSQQQ